MVFVYSMAPKWPIQAHHTDPKNSWLALSIDYEMESDLRCMKN